MKKTLYFITISLLVGTFVGISAMAYSSVVEAPTAVEILYTVQKGDSIHGIAKQFNLWAYQICDANDLRLNSVLQPGQIVKVPIHKQLAYVGAASYYSEAFRGKPMAHGGYFDPDKISAAHREFAPGTKVKVTNLNNGKSVIVKITDTGPFVEKGGDYFREIDLSYAAAKEIDMIGEGVVTVRMEPIEESIPTGDNIEIKVI